LAASATSPRFADPIDLCDQDVTIGSTRGACLRRFVGGDDSTARWEV
jgi:hypothetical protein